MENDWVLHRGYQGSNKTSGWLDTQTANAWVCLKIVYPFLPNGFADHYPY